jgi:hypothetical protein
MGAVSGERSDGEKWRKKRGEAALPEWLLRAGRPTAKELVKHGGLGVR